MKIKKKFKVLLTILLCFGLIFQPFFGVLVLAEAENEATVVDNNQAVVEDNLQTTANTGDNIVVSEATPTPEPTATPTPSVIPVEEVIPAEITPTPMPTNSAVVENDNQAVVENTATASAITGENTTAGDESKIDTGDAVVETDVVNVVDTNITGSNFEQVILNVDQSVSGDIDLSSVEIGGETSPESASVTVADFLSALAVYNTNDATLINNLQLIANSGGNQIVGPNGEILTGDALADLDLFNLVNTNLTGQNWFFGIINLLGDFEGDIILPYEWQFLGEDNSGVESQQNSTVTDSQNSVTVTNTNNADLTNNVSVSANSGNNEIIGSGDINTGNANAQANLINFVNTNITGSRWLLLAINNFGSWQGELEGWWGNMQIIPGTLFAWVKLPDLVGGATASQTSSLLVNNNNSVSVENNLEVLADTGGNSITGGNGGINTGNAQASADVLNVVNTNITGNNWYFGMINIFDDFLGNIIFPRPDLAVVKTADRNEVLTGEEITYTISYQNQGRVWAKNTIIIDSLPQGTTFVSASDGGVYQDGKVKWNLGEVYPGANGAVSLIVRVNSDVAASSELVNNVKIETSTCEPNKNNNSSSAETLVTLKTIPTPTATPGSQTGPSDGGGVGGPGGPSVCSDTVPGGAPVLLSVIAGDNSVTLTWSKAADPVSYYLVAYGLSSGNYIFGNPNIGGSETTGYTINDLSGGTTYYFVVRAGNGCTPGPFSNEIAVTPSGASLEGVAGGFFPGVLGVEAAEGELGEAGTTTGEEPGEIAGAKTNPVCPWWWILSLAQAGLLGLYYWGLGKKENRRTWWLLPIAMAVLTFLADHFLAHRYFTASRFCPLMWLWSILASIVPSGLYLYFRRK